MKKILALLLALLMVVSLAACGLSEEDIRGTVTSDVNTLEDADAQTDDTDTDSADEEKEFSVGTSSGLVYENKFIGVGCELPNDWSFYTEEQIRQVNNVTEDLVGEEYEELISQAQLVYDMCASSSDQLSSVNVILEKSDIVSVAAFDLETSGDTIVEAATDALAQLGATDITHTVSTTSFAGDDAQCLNLEMKLNGVDFYQKQVYVKTYNYITSITVASTDIDVCDEIFESFYSL